MLRRLPRLVPAAPGKPVRRGTREAQARARALATDPAAWTAEERARTIDAYRHLAPSWNKERGGYRAAPLRDALQRAGEFPDGPCVEVGSGTGLLTPWLTQMWAHVLSVDLSWDMITRSCLSWRALAEASRLPLADGTASVVVLADAPLVPPEVDRILAPQGVVVWSNALGTDAPQYIPPDEVVDALARANVSRDWTGATSDAGWGLWAVIRSS